MLTAKLEYASNKEFKIYEKDLFTCSDPIAIGHRLRFVSDKKTGFSLFPKHITWKDDKILFITHNSIYVFMIIKFKS